MEDRLHAETQIWADGYSFMEVTETLLMALGIRAAEPPPGKPEPGRAEQGAVSAPELTDAGAR